VRILVTGTRNGWDPAEIWGALVEHGDEVCTLVHGWADGVDRDADFFARGFGWEVEVYPADQFESPLKRNEYMVRLGADVCLAFADRWASGTGHCARAARRAGIPVIDYGVDTRLEARP
jgi:hypothetical protein